MSNTNSISAIAEDHYPDAVVPGPRGLAESENKVGEHKEESEGVHKLDREGAMAAHPWCSRQGRGCEWHHSQPSEMAKNRAANGDVC